MKYLLLSLIISFSIAEVSYADQTKVFTLGVTLWPGTSLEKTINCLVTDGAFDVGGDQYLSDASGTVVGWKLFKTSILQEQLIKINDVFMHPVEAVPGQGTRGEMVVRAYRVKGAAPDGKLEYEMNVLQDNENMLRSTSMYRDDLVNLLKDICLKM